MIALLAGLFFCLCAANITTCCEYLESLKDGGTNDTRFAGCLDPTWITLAKSDFTQWPASPHCTLLTSLYGQCVRRLSNDTAVCGSVGLPCFYCECVAFAATSGCDNENPCGWTAGNIAWYVFFVLVLIVGSVGIIRLFVLMTRRNNDSYTRDPLLSVNK